MTITTACPRHGSRRWPDVDAVPTAASCGIAPQPRSPYLRSVIRCADEDVPSAATARVCSTRNRPGEQQVSGVARGASPSGSVMV